MEFKYFGNTIEIIDQRSGGGNWVVLVNNFVDCEIPRWEAESYDEAKEAWFYLCEAEAATCDF